MRKTPSWPRSWANFSLFCLYSHRNVWANSHLLGQPNTFLAKAKIKSWAVCSAVALGLQILAIGMVPYWGRRYVNFKQRIHSGAGLHAEATCIKRGSKDPNSVYSF